MNPALVEVRELHYRYPDGSPALNGVNFSMQPGECVAVFGANGSGKTTFALHLAGLLTGDGSVDVRGQTGLLFQDPDDQLFMPTVLDDVAFGPHNTGHSLEDSRARALQALSSVGMTHVAEKAPYHLSAGEKRRVAIAGVLAMQPDLLIFDEPTTFLDPPTQRDLAKLLYALPQAKLLVTHDVAFAQALATRAVFFDAGRIAADGPVDDIILRFAWDFRHASRRDSPQSA